MDCTQKEDIIEINSSETKHCWFCGISISNDDYNWKFPMYKEAYRTGTLTTREVGYKETEVSIPRCVHCQQKHQQEQKKERSLTIIVWIVVFVAAIVTFLVTKGKLWWLTTLIAAAIIVVFTIIQDKKSDNQTKRKAYPKVKSLLNDGWGFAEPQAH